MVIWGIGRSADAAVMNFLSLFLLYYYNQVQGLTPVLATIALAIAILSDAISDPLVGIYSDYKYMEGSRRSKLMWLSIVL